MSGFSDGMSYRIGDHARSETPIGDHIAHVTGFEWAKSQDGNPQFKVTSKLLNLNSRQHTWYYTLTDKALYRLFQDALAIGLDPNFNPGPPGAHYMDAFRPGFLNRVLDIRLSQGKGDFPNTKVMGVNSGGAPAATTGFTAPSGFPGGTIVPGSGTTPGGGTLEGANQHDNKPVQVQPGGDPWGGTTTMHPHTAAAPFATAPPAGGAAPAGQVDPNDLFRR